MQNHKTQEKIITVTGKGGVHVVPDVTRLDVSVTGVFSTYEEAYACAKENSAWMVKILEYNHLNGKIAKTISLDISDHETNVYDDDGKYIGTEKDGYDLRQRIKVDLGIDNHLVNCIVRGVGKFVKGAQINIGYTVRDIRPFQLKMLSRAVKDASEKAAIMAEAAGCKIGKVKSIDYSNREIEIYSQARNIHSNDEAMASSSDCLDITPDDLAINDSVQVSWYLENESSGVV